MFCVGVVPGLNSGLLLKTPVKLNFCIRVDEPTPLLMFTRNKQLFVDSHHPPP